MLWKRLVSAIVALVTTTTYAASKGQAGSHDSESTVPSVTGGQPIGVRPLAPERQNRPGDTVDTTGESDDLARMIRQLEVQVKEPSVAELLNEDKKEPSKVGEQPGADSAKKTNKVE